MLLICVIALTATQFIVRIVIGHQQRGGGVIGMVPKSIQSHSIALPAKSDSIEMFAFSIIKTGGYFSFIVVYRPPELLTSWVEIICVC